MGLASDRVLTVDVDFGPLVRFLTDVKQVPYVSAVTLTRLARRGRDSVKASLGQHFTLRTGWVPRGIRDRPAEKRDWPFQQSEVGSKDAFMVAQETGGKKVPRNGGSVAEPLAIRPSKEVRTPPSKWPGAQLKRARTFTNKLRTGPRAGHLAVFRRTTGDRYPLKTLYVFEAFTPIKPRLGMRATVTKVVNADLASVWLEEMDKALQPRTPRA